MSYNKRISEPRRARMRDESFRLASARAVAADPDCKSREFDASSADFDPAAATAVFLKCRLLVVRNVLDITPYRAQFASFLRSMRSGRISRAGRTSIGEKYYYTRRESGRRDLLLPLDFADEQLLLLPELQAVLRDPGVLGPGVVLASLGSVVAEPGARSQVWHRDDPYVVSDGPHDNPHRIGGHDLPAYAVTAMVTLSNLSATHGPTEFCLGTTHLTATAPSWARALRETTAAPDAASSDVCPAEHLRVPVPRAGDLVLFDYALVHRGGPNLTAQLRALLYLTFARSWWQDGNFRLLEAEASHGVPGAVSAEGASAVRGWFEAQELSELADSAGLAPLSRLVRRARYALPDAGDPAALDVAAAGVELEGLDLPPTSLWTDLLIQAAPFIELLGETGLGDLLMMLWPPAFIFVAICLRLRVETLVAGLVACAALLWQAGMYDD